MTAYITSSSPLVLSGKPHQFFEVFDQNQWFFDSDSFPPQKLELTVLCKFKQLHNTVLDFISQIHKPLYSKLCTTQ
jgi:hypothetical protein